MGCCCEGTAIYRCWICWARWRRNVDIDLAAAQEEEEEEEEEEEGGGTSVYDVCEFDDS